MHKKSLKKYNLVHREDIELTENTQSGRRKDTVYITDSVFEVKRISLCRGIGTLYIEYRQYRV